MGWCAARSSRWASDWPVRGRDRKSTRLNSIHGYISYAVFCLKKKTNTNGPPARTSPAAPVVMRASVEVTPMILYAQTADAGDDNALAANTPGALAGTRTTVVV